MYETFNQDSSSVPFSLMTMYFGQEAAPSYVAQTSFVLKMEKDFEMGVRWELFLFTDPGTGTYRQDAGRVSGDGQQPDGEFHIQSIDQMKADPNW